MWVVHTSHKWEDTYTSHITIPINAKHTHTHTLISLSIWQTVGLMMFTIIFFSDDGLFEFYKYVWYDFTVWTEIKTFGIVKSSSLYSIASIKCHHTIFVFDFVALFLGCVRHSWAFCCKWLELLMVAHLFLNKIWRKIDGKRQRALRNDEEELIFSNIIVKI